MKLPDYNNRLRILVATYVTFSPDGTELLVNMGGEQVITTVEVGRGGITIWFGITDFLLAFFLGLSVRLDIQTEAIHLLTSQKVPNIFRLDCAVLTLNGAQMIKTLTEFLWFSSRHTEWKDNQWCLK